MKGYIDGELDESIKFFLVELDGVCIGVIIVDAGWSTGFVEDSETS